MYTTLHFIYVVIPSIFHYYPTLPEFTSLLTFFTTCQALCSFCQCFNISLQFVSGFETPDGWNHDCHQTIIDLLYYLINHLFFCYFGTPFRLLYRGSFQVSRISPVFNIIPVWHVPWMTLPNYFLIRLKSLGMIFTKSFL